jgi:hypothetical protein
MIKPRPAQPTVKCVDTYCELYKDLFVEVRAYEYFANKMGVAYLRDDLELRWKFYRGDRVSQKNQDELSKM